MSSSLRAIFMSEGNSTSQLDVKRLKKYNRLVTRHERAPRLQINLGI